MLSGTDSSHPTPGESDGGRPAVGLLVIGRKRPGFDPAWAAEMTAAAWQAAGELPIEPFRPQADAVDDATLRRAVAQLRGTGCETLIVLQPSMGDGRLAPLLGQLWDDPIVLWATPERPDGGKVSSCSLVGAHAFGSILRQLGRPFELAYGHPADQDARRQVIEAVRLTVTAARLRRAKVGLVGSHAPGFLNMHVDPAVLGRDLGVQLHQFGLQEFFDRVEGLPEGAVEEDVAQAAAMGLPFADDTGPADLAANSRYYLAMRALMAEETLDALAVRCWPELPGRFGAWPYLAMARLADEGSTVALEGDVDGAVTCLVGQWLGFGPGYVSDWLEHDAHSITLWHPGHAPAALCEPGSRRLGRHFNNRLPLVIDAALAVDRPITLCRLWSCDGRYRLTACDARTAPPRRELAGASGLAVIDDRDVRCWFDELCHEGMPHHAIVLPGHAAAMLKRLARLVGVAWVADQ